MENLYEKLIEASQYIQSAVSLTPEIAVILGSGLGDLSGELINPQVIPYGGIPHFPVSSVAGHAGRLLFGTLHGKNVMMMEGRPHYYEGFSMKQLAFPVFLMKFLGVKRLIITNACGGINKEFSPGTLMIIEDFINLVSDNPLIGSNDERIGPRFPDMSEPYSFRIIAAAEKIADELGIPHSRGVYAGFQGPYYETAAEIRSIAAMGADAVGMSTVPETIAANYAGVECFAVACITNMATGIQKMKHSHERVLEIANRASADLSLWISSLIRSLPAD
jgi:purine-nucleoside phosphorylase